MTSQDSSYADQNRRLRLEVARLKFELIQKESECMSLRSLIETNRMESTERTQRLVNEAKQMMHDYYAGYIDLQKQRHANEINELLTENAKLQEQLDAEKVARSIDLEEFEELKARLEEFEQDKCVTVTVTDSEDEDDNSDDDEVGWP